VAVFVLPAAASDWPQWHGPLRDRHTPDPVAARLDTWPVDREPSWRIGVGPGHAAPVVSGNHLVYLDDDGKRTIAHGLDATTGSALWHTPFADHFEDEWGVGPRCAPLIDADRVYVQSPQGEFRCLNLADGTLRWSVSFTRDYGARFAGAGGGEGAAERRGYNGSGIVENGLVILAVGSTQGATLVALDKLTGRERWRAGNDAVAYSSPVTSTLGGVRQVIAFTADALMGVRVSDGRVLWRIPFRTMAQRHIATPLIAGDLVIVNSHTFGMAAVRITAAPDGCSATEAWRNPDLKVNIATATLVDRHLYTFGATKDFLCVDVATGKLAWSQSGFAGPGRRDYASVIAAGQRLLVLNEEGLLRVLEASPQRYAELAQAQICGNTWAFPALANGRLYVRDGRQLSCYTLPGGKDAQAGNSPAAGTRR
jgi:outer membrane protein assembly factor BamB